MDETKKSITLIEAIEGRHSWRDYTSEKLERGAITPLLNAAVRTPTAMHQEPWVFFVVQDSALLKHISTISEIFFVKEIDHGHLDRGGHALDAFKQPDFNPFYNASTLIVICAKEQEHFKEADCWLAAENLMLAACAQGL